MRLVMILLWAVAGWLAGMLVVALLTLDWSALLTWSPGP